jgi:RNA polymerase primary sigma factor
MVRLNQQVLSLEQATREPNGAPWAETLEDQQAVAPAEAVERSLLHDRLSSLVGTLPDRERTVIELRFGLTDDHQRTLREVGDAIGLSKERVRKLECIALERLQQTAGSGTVRAFLG